MRRPVTFIGMCLGSFLLGFYWAEGNSVFSFGGLLLSVILLVIALRKYN